MNTLEEKIPVEGLLYKNLVKWFNWTVTQCLGERYYNLGQDVYQTHQLCCKDLVEEFESLKMEAYIWERVAYVSVALNVVGFVAMLMLKF